MHQPLAPITVPWALKPLESAQTSVEQLPDGRVRYAIRHDVLRGVTPEMLVWWFQHLEGPMRVGGVEHERYRVWHPRDHVAVRYVRRLPDGSIGPGAQIHIREFFAAKPENEIDIVATIERLDTGGFVHAEHVWGQEIGRMSYRFTRVDGGTLYENELVMGSPGALRTLLNPVVRRVFPEKKGRAWLLHNIEEVGAFESFLPELYETSRR